MGFVEGFGVLEWRSGYISNDTVNKATPGAGIASSRIPASEKSFRKKHLTIRKEI